MSKNSRLIILGLGFLLVFSTGLYQDRKTKKILRSEVSALNKELGGEEYDGNLKYGTISLDTSILKTARKRVAELNLYKSFFEEIPIGLLVKQKFQDCDCFRVIAFNPAWEKSVLIPSKIDPKSYMYSSDFDLWPDSLARLYDAQDNYAVDNNSVDQFDAPIVVDGQAKQGPFIRYSDDKKRLYLIYTSIKAWDEL